MRIAHLSDLHASAEEDADQKEIAQAVLDDLVEQDHDTRLDLFVFSGDLAFDGTSGALRTGRSLLLDPLVDRFPGRPVVVVPGNHDVNRTRIDPLYEAGLQAVLKAREDVNKVLDNEEGLAKAAARLGEWNEFQADWEKTHPLVEVPPLARVGRWNCGGLEVGVACLNTAWRASGGEEDRARLLLGENQVANALARIDDAEIRIVVMHHPLDWLADFDAEAARDQFNRAGVFVLTGHDHYADPTTEIGLQGAALHGRAGCLYAGHSFSNSYTLLTLDQGRQQVSVAVRRWWDRRREFAQAADLPGGGTVDLPWPERQQALPASRAAFAAMISPLAEIAQEQSVLSADTEEPSTVFDVLIPPRFWPVPHREIIKSALPPDSRPKRVDPIQLLETCDALIVSGGHFSGVTSAVLWILERHYRVRQSHLPAYVRIDPRFSLGKLRDAVDAARGRGGATADESIPVLLGIDDALPQDSRALGRLLRFVKEHPNVKVVLGSHGEAHEAIAETLREGEVPHERVFLGPLGRAELRELATRIVGPGAADVVQRVLQTIHQQRLPRNPLNIAALVSVVVKEPDLTDVNESGLLQSYVRVLLENPIAGDPEGLGMDYRRRELLLIRLAKHLVQTNRTRLSRGATEQLVLDFFVEVGWTPGSAGRLVDSFIRRRVLVEDEAGVGFRYRALLYLFAGQAVREDGEFRNRILSDALVHSEIIRHAAGLDRADRELLEAVGTVALEALQYGAPGVSVSQFDLLEDRDGWSQVKDLDQVRGILRSNPRPPTEEELDEIYEEVVESPPEETPLELVEDGQRTFESMGRVEAAIILLGGVLQNSEAVPDVALKAELLERAIHGWTLATIVTAVKEDETGGTREMFDELLGEMEPAKRDSLVQHISRLFVVLGGTLALYATTGSRHLEGALARILDDEGFMRESGSALFATMLYMVLELPRWPQRMAALVGTHGSHPMVRELARLWGLAQYRARKVHGQDETVLEQVLLDILEPPVVSRSPARERAQQRDHMLKELRAGRLRDGVAGQLGVADDDSIDEPDGFIADP
jgi:predicted MPP superfamily phosphohydrolase